MIRLFRKIRQKLLSENEYSLYILYASGEIVLVVIGILLALQIDNWNENRKEENTVKEYAVSLVHDLEEDLIMVNAIILQSNDIVERINSLGNYVQNKKMEDISNLYVLCLTLNKPHRPYIWNRATVDELKSTGILGFIKDEALSKMIANYDALTHHLDVDYINDRVQFEKATALTTEIVNNNYPNFTELHAMLLPLNNVRDYDFVESEEYKQAEAYNFRLLSDDMNELHKAVNNFNLLKAYFQLRTDHELPELIEKAKELIRLLKETYID
jgi:hypothetical protein